MSDRDDRPLSFPDDPGVWKVLTREYLARKLWYTVRVDRVELPNGTVIPEYWISEYAPWVTVVALPDRDEVDFTRQYRHGIGAVHYEIPAGSSDPGDTSMEGGGPPPLPAGAGPRGGGGAGADHAP